MKLSTRLFPLLLGPLCGACVVSIGDDWDADVVGSGVSRTESRSVGEFKRIHINGGIDLVAEVGGATALEITADDNLLAYLETYVEGETLVIEMQDGSYSARVPQVARVSTPVLQGLEIDGSCDASIHRLAGPEFALAISGSGDVRCDGAVDLLVIDIAGSGDVRARELLAKRARIVIAGSGDVHVNATEDLDISIAGSGDVRYAGSPRVRQSVAGSGDVQHE